MGYIFTKQYEICIKFLNIFEDLFIFLISFDSFSAHPKTELLKVPNNAVHSEWCVTIFFWLILFFPFIYSGYFGVNHQNF